MTTEAEDGLSEKVDLGQGRAGKGRSRRMAATKGVRPHDNHQANRHDRCSGGQLTPLARTVLEDMSSGQDQERDASLHPRPVRSDQTALGYKLQFVSDWCRLVARSGDGRSADDCILLDILSPLSREHARLQSQ